MAWGVRIELYRAPEHCAKTCWARATKPHPGPCASAEASWPEKPETKAVRATLTALLRTHHPELPGDKIHFTKPLPRHVPAKLKAGKKR